MSQTTIYTKPIKSPFDILTSQTEIVGNEEDEFKIPIKKVFDNVPKPTELEPIHIDRKNDDTQESNSIPDEKFLAPKQIIGYLDDLIIQSRRPLKALKFDIEESSSVEEVKKFINSTNLLTQTEKNSLLDLLLDGSEKTVNIDTVRDDKLIASVITSANNPVDLNIVRKDYIDLLAPYLRKINIDQKNFEKMMAEFGVNKKMPKKDEPRELTLAKEDYFNQKNLAIKNIGEELSVIEFNLEETSVFRKELSKLLDFRLGNISEKAEALWNKGVDGKNTESISFLLEDTDFVLVTKLSDEQKFEGFRAPDAQKTEQVVEKVAETVEIPKETPVENLPLQNTVQVAESVNSSIETFPSDFEGKDVLVIRGEGSNKNFIKVMFDNKEIAIGEITAKGPNIKIKSEFKAGWLYKKTLEQRAFDEKIYPFLKTLKI